MTRVQLIRFWRAAAGLFAMLFALAAGVAWKQHAGGADARAALASAEWAVAQRDSVIVQARREIRRRDAAVTVAQAGTDSALAAAWRAAGGRRGEMRGAVPPRGRSGPVSVAPPVAPAACDCEAVQLALVQVERAVALERVAFDSSLAVRDSLIATEPARIEALVAVAVLGEQQRREAAEAEARAANRRVWRARAETVVVGIITFFVGRAL